MTVINTNVGALNARVAALGAQGGMEKAMQRLSSGLRINQAADDAAGLAVATKMESQLRGINMAIRNSNDGISLVQTAESGMAEISNMVIRMRELSVQMANGIYSDGDRANAQLEVDALLAEIDKIANNTAFNGVKVIDGSYNSEIRAGNTNAEVIGIAVDRMNTDSLGGVAITTASDAAIDTSSTFVHTAAKTRITAAEGQVQISKDIFNQGFKDFVVANAAGTYSVSSTDDGALFQVNQTTGAVTLKDGVGELDFDTPRDANFDGTYEFSVTYTVGSESVTENLMLTISNTAVVSSSANTATTNISVVEAETVGFETVGASGLLSDAFKEFVAADTGTTGAFTAMAGTGDNQFFSINTSTGAITVTTGTFDFENPVDTNTASTASQVNSDGTAGNNIYSIQVVYTDSNSRVFTETVNITVTNDSVADAGSIAVTNERGDRGRSNMNLNLANTDVSIDFSSAAIQELFSQGAKDFITRQGGAGSTFTFFELAATPEGVTGSLNVSGAAGDSDGDGTNDVVLTVNGGAANTAGPLLSAASTLAIGNDSGNGTVTVKMTLGNLTNLSGGGANQANEVFEEFITLNIADNGAAGTGAVVQGTGRTEQTGAVTTYTGTSDGEAVNISLGDRTLFADLVAYTDAHSGGSFALTSQHDDAFGGASAITDFSLSGNTLTLAAGANADQRFVVITYTDRDGNTFTQDIDYTTIAASNPSTATATQTSTNQTKDAIAQSTEVTGGKSVIQVNEAGEATIQVAGGNGVLSPELSTFQNTYASGTWSLSGADAADFELDKLGNVTSKIIMNYEEKAQHNFNLTYTVGDNSYTETIVLNVANSTVDDGDHIANVNIATQQGAQDAINILDTALGQITAAQAKLGSSQNRLQHNIDNLTAASSLTEQARGRITDADFALETSQLSKQQILSQAATSMLAQANQSKQSVLALLQ